MTYALIFAGGIGKRMNHADIPKQFMEVNGKSILIRTLEHFSGHKAVDEIVVVCVENWIEELNRQISEHDIQKIAAVIPGGETGFDSIHEGIMYLYPKAEDYDVLLICDGVRPMLTEALIDQCIEQTKEYGNAVPVTTSMDSVLYSEDGKTAQTAYDREKCYVTQAPQGYRFEQIFDAHRIAIERGMKPISSADLMMELERPVHLYEGIRENIKVTTQEDLEALRSTYYFRYFKNFMKEEFAHESVG